MTSPRVYQIDLSKLDISDVDSEFEIVESDYINVIFLGVSKSGKSTAIEILKDPLKVIVVEKGNLWSVTRDATPIDFNLKPKNGMNTNLRIIDTPGFKEERSGLEDEFDNRDDDQIVEAISECLKKEITYVNCIVIFIHFKENLTGDDADALKKIMDNFTVESATPKESVDFLVCITHAEAFSKVTRERILYDLEISPKTEGLRKYNIEYCFTGCVTSEIQEEFHPLYFKQVMKYRNIIFGKIVSKSKKIYLETFPIVERHKANTLAAISRLREVTEKMVLTIGEMSMENVLDLERKFSNIRSVELFLSSDDRTFCKKMLQLLYGRRDYLMDKFKYESEPWYRKLFSKKPKFKSGAIGSSVEIEEKKE